MADLQPRAILLSNLFRDQLDRYGELETIADRWAQVAAGAGDDTRLVLNADDPLVADLGRAADGAERRARTREGADGEARRPACPTSALTTTPRAARDPARGRLQALPTLRRGLPLRGRLPGPSWPLRLSVVRRAPAATRGRGRARAPARRAQRVVRPAHARGQRPCRPPPAGPVQRLQRPRCGGPVPRARGAAPRDRRRPADRGRRLRPGRDDRGRRAPGVDPAGQEPGRAPTRSCARSLLEEGRLDVYAALNDGVADGRDVSWIWDADFELLSERVERVTCSGTRAAELALRLKYAGVDEGLTIVDRPGPRAWTGAGRRQRPAVRAAHLHGAAGAARPAVRPRPRAALLAMSATALGGRDLA